MEVLAGDDVLIAGFIITGPPNSTKKVMIRALGPSLTAAGVSNAISDPRLELHAADGQPMSVNGNWQDGPNVTEIPNGFQPSDPRESVIIATLSVDSDGTANYTAVVRGVNGATGVGLVEAYDLSQAATSSRTSAHAGTSTRAQT